MNASQHIQYTLTRPELDYPYPASLCLTNHEPCPSDRRCMPTSVTCSPGRAGGNGWPLIRPQYPQPPQPNHQVPDCQVQHAPPPRTCKHQHHDHDDSSPAGNHPGSKPSDCTSSYPCARPSRVKSGQPSQARPTSQDPARLRMHMRMRLVRHTPHCHMQYYVGGRCWARTAVHGIIISLTVDSVCHH